MTQIVYGGNPTASIINCPIADIPTLEAGLAWHINAYVDAFNAETRNIVSGQPASFLATKQTFQGADGIWYQTAQIAYPVDPQWEVNGKKIWRNVYQVGTQLPNTLYNTASA